VTPRYCGYAGPERAEEELQRFRDAGRENDIFGLELDAARRALVLRDGDAHVRLPFRVRVASQRRALAQRVRERRRRREVVRVRVADVELEDLVALLLELPSRGEDVADGRLHEAESGGDGEALRRRCAHRVRELGLR